MTGRNADGRAPPAVRVGRAVPSTLAQVERHFDEQTVLEVGGWDRRYAVVRAVRTVDDRAAAVIDSNGDGGDINLEHFAMADGQWQLLSSSGSAGNWGRGWCDGMWAEHDRDDNGWWLTLEPGPAEEPDR